MTNFSERLLSSEDEKLLSDDDERAISHRVGQSTSHRVSHSVSHSASHSTSHSTSHQRDQNVSSKRDQHMNNLMSHQIKHQADKQAAGQRMSYEIDRKVSHQTDHKISHRVVNNNNNKDRAVMVAKSNPHPIFSRSEVSSSCRDAAGRRTPRNARTPRPDSSGSGGVKEPDSITERLRRCGIDYDAIKMAARRELVAGAASSGEDEEDSVLVVGGGGGERGGAGHMSAIRLSTYDDGDNNGSDFWTNYARSSTTGVVGNAAMCSCFRCGWENGAGETWCGGCRRVLIGGGVGGGGNELGAGGRGGRGTELEGEANELGVKHMSKNEREQGSRTVKVEDREDVVSGGGGEGGEEGGDTLRGFGDGGAFDREIDEFLNYTPSEVSDFVSIKDYGTTTPALPPPDEMSRPRTRDVYAWLTPRSDASGPNYEPTNTRTTAVEEFKIAAALSNRNQDRDTALCGDDVTHDYVIRGDVTRRDVTYGTVAQLRVSGEGEVMSGDLVSALPPPPPVPQRDESPSALGRRLYDRTNRKKGSAKARLSPRRSRGSPNHARSSG